MVLHKQVLAHITQDPKTCSLAVSVSSFKEIYSQKVGRDFDPYLEISCIENPEAVRTFSYHKRLLLRPRYLIACDIF